MKRAILGLQQKRAEGTEECIELVVGRRRLPTEHQQQMPPQRPFELRDQSRIRDAPDEAADFSTEGTVEPIEFELQRGRLAKAVESAMTICRTYFLRPALRLHLEHLLVLSCLGSRSPDPATAAPPGSVSISG